MQYLLLIYGDEAAGNERFETMSEEERNQTMGEWFRYTEELHQAGVHVAGEALQPTATAKTVTVPNGEPLVTDGPFAETKEQLGGFYLLECRDLDEAIEMAAKIPGASSGAVEVRPVVERPESSE